MSFPAQPPHQSALNHTVTITHQPLIIRGRIQVSEGSLDLLQVAAEYLTGLISCLPYNHPIFLNNYELLEANKKNKKKMFSLLSVFAQTVFFLPWAKPTGPWGFNSSILPLRKLFYKNQDWFGCLFPGSQSFQYTQCPETVSIFRIYISPIILAA